MAGYTPYPTGKNLSEQQAVGVSAGDNRLNSSGLLPGNSKYRTSFIYENIIPAGQTIPVPSTGSMFYVEVCTTAVEIRPSGGVFNQYVQGQGIFLGDINAFDLLEIRNPSDEPIVIRLFVGFQGFIDNRLILATNEKQVAYPTCKIANTEPIIEINDLSGNAFLDINGNRWYALYRIAIIISNVDTGATYWLQQADAATAADGGIAAVFPQTSLQYPVSGDYRLNAGGGNINCLVSELYAAIKAAAT